VVCSYEQKDSSSKLLDWIRLHLVLVLVIMVIIMIITAITIIYHYLHFFHKIIIITAKYVFSDTLSANIQIDEY
jgi:hypothetical protein